MRIRTIQWNRLAFARCQHVDEEGGCKWTCEGDPHVNGMEISDVVAQHIQETGHCVEVKRVHYTHMYDRD